MTGADPAGSAVYGHLWATQETRELFDDRGRTRAWLEIIAALAAAQGELGIIPAARGRGDRERRARRAARPASPSGRRPGAAATPRSG